MRVLIIADVHGNLPALEAVLADAGPVDEIWSLGDLVGYGPHPNEVVQLLRSLPFRSLAGNHDWGATGQADLSVFNADARAACQWTDQMLTHETREYLLGLEVSSVFGSVHVAHGSPREPLWEYLTNVRLAEINFGYFGTQVCLVGHTHVPIMFRWRQGVHGAGAFLTAVPNAGDAIDPEDDRLIFNPGSVGQPRDGDPRAAYARYEPATGRFTFHRVAYDIAATQTAMRAAGLPERLAFRLQYGS